MISSIPFKDEAAYVRIIRGVIGSQFVRVRYLVPAGSSWPGGRQDGMVHEVDHGVELGLLDGSALLVQWEMQGDNEFLSVASSSSTEAAVQGLIDAVDVTSMPEWTHVLGRTIDCIGVARHVSGSGSPESFWALRFCLEGGASFVIALGEMREGIPAYLPDAVVVLFDRRDAESYMSAGSVTSAWGEDLPVT
jgi:hypothetical protein